MLVYPNHKQKKSKNTTFCSTHRCHFHLNKTKTNEYKRNKIENKKFIMKFF